VLSSHCQTRTRLVVGGEIKRFRVGTICVGAMCAHNVAVLPHSGHRFVSPTLAMAHLFEVGGAQEIAGPEQDRRPTINAGLALLLKQYHVSVNLRRRDGGESSSVVADVCRQLW
jgi:hypothetical protein